MTKGNLENRKPRSVKVKEEESIRVLKSTELIEEDEEPEGHVRNSHLSSTSIPLVKNPDNSIELKHVDESKLETTAAELIPGQTVEDFEVLEHLGSGGMGDVFKVKHIEQEGFYALKILRKELLRDRASKKRFEQEAKTCRALNSPYIVSTYDSGITKDGVPFILMELVEGKSLASLLKENRCLNKEDFRVIFAQVAEALGYAHQFKILHRDLKPSNIIISKDERGKLKAKLADFGISRILHESDREEQQVTKTGELIGSPIYMSPEQCTSAVYDQRSDIYSLGVVMYEAITGDPPFVGNNAISTIMKHVNDTPKPINRLSLGDEEGQLIEQIIFKCLEKDPERRYKSAIEIGIDIESIDCDPENFDKQRLLTNCRKDKMRRYLDRNARLLFISIFATLAVSALIYKVKDANYKQALFNNLVTRAETAYSYGDDAHGLWLRAFDLAEKLGKDNRTKGLIMLNAGKMNFTPDNLLLVPYQGTRGTSEIEKSYELISHSGASGLEKLRVMQNLANYYVASNEAAYNESFYYSADERQEALKIRDKGIEKSVNQDYVGATKFFEEAFKKGAMDDLTIRHLGNTYAGSAFEAKNPMAKVALFEKSLLYTNCDSHRLSRWKNLNEAMKAAGLDPLSYEDRLKLGKVAEQRGDLESAALEFHAALALKQEDGAKTALIQVQKQLSDQRHKKKERVANRAIPLFEKLLEQLEIYYPGPNTSRTYRKKQLAKFYKDLGEYQKAVNIYQPLLDNDYRDKNQMMVVDDHLADYVECLYLTGDVDGAMRMANSWLEVLAPGPPSFPGGGRRERLVNIVANCHLLRGRFDLYEAEIAGKYCSYEEVPPDAFTSLPYHKTDFGSGQ